MTRYDTTVLSDNPVGYWPMTETSGDALDKSGNGNNGVLVAGVVQGAAELVNGSGGAYQFDGIAGDVDMGSADILDNIMDGGGTAEIWVAIDSDGGGNNGSIAGKQQWRLRTRVESGGFVAVEFFFLHTGTDIQWRTLVDIPLGERTHLVVTYDVDSLSNVPTLYRNGLPDAGFFEQTGPPTGVPNAEANADVVVGDRDTPGQTFDGRESHFAMYDTVLSAARILEHFRVGSVGEPTLHTVTEVLAGDAGPVQASFRY